MTLSDLVPGVSTAKWIGIGIGALVLAGLLAFGFFTIKGWHDDAAQLPVVTAQRDAALAAYKSLDSDLAGKMGDIATRLAAIDKDRAASDADITSNQTAIAAAIAAFKGKPANATPLCPEPQSMRDGLLNLFAAPAAGAKPGAPGGGSESGSAAQPPGAGAAAGAVPGRQRAAEDGQGLLVPAAGGRGGVAPGRQLAEPGRHADRRAAAGSRSALPGFGVGQWAGFRAAVRATATRAGQLAKLIGNAVLETVRDDKRDA